MDKKGAKYVTAILKLKNMNQESIVAFKILSKKAERYMVNPNIGLMHPNEELEVCVVLNYERLSEKEDFQANIDKFQILSIVIKNGLYNSLPKQIFQKASSERISKQYIKCQFVNKINEMNFSPINYNKNNSSSPTQKSIRERELEKRIKELEKREKELSFNLKQALTLRDRKNELPLQQNTTISNTTSSSIKPKSPTSFSLADFLIYFLCFFVGFLLCLFLFVDKAYHY